MPLTIETLTPLQQDILAVLNTIPDGPHWVAWGDIAVAVGRPRSQGYVVASSAMPIGDDLFDRWDQIRDEDGMYHTEQYRSQRDRRLMARGVPVVDGRAWWTYRLRPFIEGGWGTAVR